MHCFCKSSSDYMGMRFFTSVCFLNTSWSCFFLLMFIYLYGLYKCVVNTHFFWLFFFLFAWNTDLWLIHGADYIREITVMVRMLLFYMCLFSWENTHTSVSPNTALFLCCVVESSLCALCPKCCDHGSVPGSRSTPIPPDLQCQEAMHGKAHQSDLI